MGEVVSRTGTVTVEEHERLLADFAALSDQFVATNEVLAALGRSAGDPDTVLSTIVRSARRLCRSDAAHVYLNDGGVYRLITAVGLSQESIAYIAEHPMPINRDTLIGRVGLDRTPQQIADVLADPDYGRHDLQQVAGFRTTMGAPMLVDDEVVGAMAVWRNDVDPFDEGEMAIVSAFACQAALAINGLSLVQELQAREGELARRVEELEALRAVGQAVSSSLDVDEVLTMIAEHAVELSATDGGSIMEYAEEERCFRVRAVSRTEQSIVDQLRSVHIGLEDTLVGRAAQQRRPLSVTDLEQTALDPHTRILFDAGWRSLVAVPMLREGQVVGALVVRRKRTGDFSPEVLTLLETFAAQSALALINARLYRDLQEQSAALRSASRHKSEFLASMSHELRTPLNAVLGFSEVLLERMFGEINERQEEYLRDIHDSGQHLLELLNEILDLSKVEAGKMELDSSTFDLHVLLEHTASMLRERAAAHGVALGVDVDPALGEVYADELRLKQVVLNLLTNAVKFTEAGGSVVVRALRHGSELHITVTDTGVGIPEADRERIFESFQQGGRGVTREEGTGLGLTLSRQIVELLGGRLWLESEVGVGSTFGFSLPAAGVAHGAPRAAPAEPASRVVVIEDDRASLDLLTAFLSGVDLEITTARDGRAGLDAVRQVRPAAVLLDIRLPGMDGWSVLHALKARPETRDIPVIIVSMVDQPANGPDLGVASYLVKPVSRGDLIAALSSVGVPVVPPAAAGRAVPVR
jgi:signal transduction histidine kinase/ActR/RegA family two-component response regulator